MSVRDAFGRFTSSTWGSSLDTETMEWHTVSSSNVAAVGYNPGREVMGVTFLSGSEYNYFGVPEDIYEAVRDAPSVGKALNALVKRTFSYERIG